MKVKCNTRRIRANVDRSKAKKSKSKKQIMKLLKENEPYYKSINVAIKNIEECIAIIDDVLEPTQ